MRPAVTIKAALTLDGEYLRAVRELCDERDVLLIADDVQAGMGRTGHLRLRRPRQHLRRPAGGGRRRPGRDRRDRTAGFAGQLPGAGGAVAGRPGRPARGDRRTGPGIATGSGTGGGQRGRGKRRGFGAPVVDQQCPPRCYPFRPAPGNNRRGGG